jgi:hypothetical protein
VRLYFGVMGGKKVLSIFCLRKIKIKGITWDSICTCWPIPCAMKTSKRLLSLQLSMISNCLSRSSLIQGKNTVSWKGPFWVWFSLGTLPKWPNSSSTFFTACTKRSATKVSFWRRTLATVTPSSYSTLSTKFTSFTKRKRGSIRLNSIPQLLNTFYPW